MFFSDAPIYWEPYFLNNPLPQGTAESTTGSDMVGRYDLGGGKIIPGLINLVNQQARFVDEASEYILQTVTHSAVQLEILVTRTPYHPVWVRGVPGVIPQGAVIGGQLPGGEILYVSAGKHVAGTTFMIPGHYKTGDLCAAYQFDGLQCAAEYDMLILQRGN